MSDLYEESLKLHAKYHGKLKIEPKVSCENAHDLSIAYTPGVAKPCLAIHENPEDSYYSALSAEGETEEYCLTTDGDDNLIKVPVFCGICG